MSNIHNVFETSLLYEKEVNILLFKEIVDRNIVVELAVPHECGELRLYKDFVKNEDCRKIVEYTIG